MTNKGIKEMIWYKEIEKHNFKKTECFDSVHFSQFGYPYSIFELKFGKYVFDWEQSSQTCRLLKTQKDGTILSEIKIKDANHLDEMVAFFKGGGK